MSAHITTSEAPGLSAALTIEGFCQSNGGISKSFYHKLVKEGKGPRLMKVGRRTLITPESNSEWRARMEAATNQKQGGA